MLFQSVTPVRPVKVSGYSSAKTRRVKRFIFSQHENLLAPLKINIFPAMAVRSAAVIYSPNRQ
jgi:hypothetical protein